MKKLDNYDIVVARKQLLKKAETYSKKHFGASFKEVLEKIKSESVGPTIATDTLTAYEIMLRTNR